nr:immunoglobulin heavy chain junction region [Macaca mulatta]
CARHDFGTGGRSPLDSW